MAMFLLIGGREGPKWHYFDPSFQKPLTNRGFFVVRRCPALAQDRFMLAFRFSLCIGIAATTEVMALKDP